MITIVPPRQKLISYIALAPMEGDLRAYFGYTLYAKKTRSCEDFYGNAYTATIINNMHYYGVEPSHINHANLVALDHKMQLNTVREIFGSKQRPNLIITAGVEYRRLEKGYTRTIAAAHEVLFEFFAACD